MTMPKSEILYFPYIEFYDDAWLKGALCHWDKIYRIVPPSYTPYDSDEVKEAVNAGLVESINLTSGDLSDTADKFIKFWNSASFIPAGFDKHNEELARLHPLKVDERIRTRLFNLSQQIDQNGFQYIPRSIANSYMLFLSESVSRNRLIPKITDDVDMLTAITYYQEDGKFSEDTYKENCKEIVANLALSSLVPNGIGTYPMSKVIKYHQANQEGREAFREAVDNLIDELKGIKNAEFFEKRILKFEEDLNNSKKSLLTVIKKDRGDFGYALLTVGLPMAIGAFPLIGMATNQWSFQSIGSSALLGIVAALADTARSRRSSWTSKEASYWLSLQTNFKRGDDIRTQLPHFHRKFEEFLND